MVRETLPLLVMGALTLAILWFLAAPIPRYSTLLSVDDYAVYTAALADVHPGDLLSRDVMSAPDPPTRLNSSIDSHGPGSETLEDFRHVNKHPVQLEIAALGKLPLVLTTQGELKELEMREVQGRIQVSRVGFNHDRTEALVYVEQHGMGSGDGSFLVMSKVHGRWRVRTRTLAWSWIA